MYACQLYQRLLRRLGPRLRHPCPGRLSVPVRGVTDLADEHLQDVFQSDQAEDPARGVGDLREMRRGTAHHRQGVVEREFRAQRRHGTPDLLRHRAVVVG